MENIIKLSDFGAISNGFENCFDALKACFEKASEQKGSVVIIEPGEYLVDSFEPVPLCSDIKVFAHGAKFIFPKNLGKRFFRRMFCGWNIKNFEWCGGHFEGYVYDANSKDNLWPPYAFTGCICIYAKDDGCVKNISVSGATGNGVAGTVVSVEGTKKEKAVNISVKDCEFLKCARFMWDYGYLWQRVVFDSEYDENSVRNAFDNIPKEHISSPLSLSKDGGIVADFMPKKLPDARDTVTFFGKTLPEGIKRGKQYFVVNKGAENSLFISETENGEHLKIKDIPEETYLFRNMFYIFHDLYCPFGIIDRKSQNVKDPGGEKGSINIINAINVNVSSCRVCGEGDSTHVSESENVVFANNQILGSRMGAMYIGFFCKNVTITGNTVYGTNGSRSLSVELCTQDITLSGNVFVGGGRGNWFNCPKNVIVSNNLFISNTQKCVPDINIGRISHVTGEYEKYPELYFTSNENADEYGSIVIKGNIFETSEGASAAIAFNPGGKNIVVEGNIFKGNMRDVHVANGCEEPLISNNQGIGKIKEHTFVNTANQR